VRDALALTLRCAPWRLGLVVLVALAVALGGGSSVVAARSRLPPDVSAVVLPGDHGAHPAFQVEWWYTAGTASDRRGREVFWFATVWVAGGAAVARVNVVDLGRDRVVLAREYSSHEPPAAGVSDVRVDDFRLRCDRLGRWGGCLSRPRPVTGALRCVWRRAGRTCCTDAAA
jgi:hypothetical protein